MVDTKKSKRILPKTFGPGEIRTKRLKGDITSLEINKIAYISKPILSHSTSPRILSVSAFQPRHPPPCPPPTLFELLPKIMPVTTTVNAVSSLMLKWVKVKNTTKKVVAYSKRKQKQKATIEEKPITIIEPENPSKSAVVKAELSTDTKHDDSNAIDELLLLDLHQLEAALYYVLQNDGPNESNKT